MAVLPFRRRTAPRETRLQALTRRIGGVQEVRGYATTPWSRKFLTLVEWELKQRLNEEAYVQIQERKERAA